MTPSGFNFGVSEGQTRAAAHEFFGHMGSSPLGRLELKVERELDAARSKSCQRLQKAGQG
jgi:hypothetical protein